MHAFKLEHCELGVATAATQIEGGRVASNWQRWADQGHIKDNTSPARATDHWNRVESDVALLGELGIRHYRLGLDWPRLEPRPGEFDAEAFEHYRRELILLREAGVRPLVTLHHFGNPLWFEDMGGFEHPDARSILRRFVGRVQDELGDQVDEWITINEPNIYAIFGYQDGGWPPGVRSLRRFLKVLSTLAAVHIDAYLLIHERRPDARVGLAHHLRVFRPANLINPLYRVLSLLIERIFQGAVVRATSVGAFAWPLPRPRGIRRGRYYDFHGVNYYSRSTISGFRDGVPAGVPINDLGWEIYPEGLVDVCRRIHRAHPAPIYITENGTADAGDVFRARYIYEHLAKIAASDLPIQRYYHWTFIDNWEWLEGESARFGLVALDFETQERTVRPSGRFFADVIANRGVTERAYDEFVSAQAYSV